MEKTLTMTKRIAVIPGDGIGVDVTAEAVKVLETLRMARALPVGMMLDHLGFPEEAASVEHAVAEAIRQDKTTSDLGSALGTSQVGDWICSRL
jgi:isocitrate/isopropylmalate dehydrogenase